MSSRGRRLWLCGSLLPAPHFHHPSSWVRAGWAGAGVAEGTLGLPSLNPWPLSDSAEEAISSAVKTTPSNRSDCLWMPIGPTVIDFLFVWLFFREPRLLRTLQICYLLFGLNNWEKKKYNFVWMTCLVRLHRQCSMLFRQQDNSRKVNVASAKVELSNLNCKNLSPISYIARSLLSVK